HPDRAAGVRSGVDLAADLIAGTAFAVATRIASLNDEIRHDAVKGQAVEVAFAGERDEAVHGDRGVFRKEFDPDRPFGCVNCGGDSFVDARGDALVKAFVMARLNDANAVGEISFSHLLEQING